MDDRPRLVAPGDKVLVHRVQEALSATSAWYVSCHQVLGLANHAADRPGGGIPDKLMSKILAAVPAGDRARNRALAATNSLAEVLPDVNDVEGWCDWLRDKMLAIRVLMDSCAEVAERIADLCGQWRIDSQFEELMKANYGREGQADD